MTYTVPMEVQIQNVSWPQPYYCPWCLRNPIHEKGHIKMRHELDCPFGLYLMERHPYLKECTGKNKLCYCRQFHRKEDPLA